MKLLRPAAALAAAAVLAVTLSACGGDSEAATRADGGKKPAATNHAEDTTTLRQLMKLDETPAKLSDATLVLVDYQNVYTGGPMELTGWRAAVKNTEALLERARAAHTPVVHIVEKGYDLKSKAGQIIPALKPAKGETVVEKAVPNGFHDTDLDAVLKKTGRKNVIIAGFMTHMCTLFTTEGAVYHGYRPTVVGDASATRPLPVNGNPRGIPAQQVHEAALATIQDRFGVVVPKQRDIK
ncbi:MULTISPECIES: cysteine hydrolase family protein [unclassified Streptomyces]|uniref:cysteine hydrolase family protein n=1 Tax=unclassified Streptomyces TaxID=2593676 RepID=UPI000DB9B66F|nr:MULTISPECIES: cysteine hydrolase family protein [unclassified Streptomyces]MYT75761.1 isochorismatase family protein [Streptomyces sp. SID8367]RAJ87172.1 nicotinamidase-related amidase [Streptomyces sp. PsTaAH-137]